MGTLNTMLKIKFPQLKQALDKLGFEETWIKGSYVKFNNPQADAIIVLSSHQIDKEIKPAYMRMVEKVLEEKGIIRRDKFESLFHDFTSEQSSLV
jgi:predicted RNA binding protein YcfA (HicA-like mRNA interferase family)